MSSFDTNTDVTFWNPTGNNGTGGKTWSTPVNTKAMIAEANETVFNEEGKEITASKSVYTRVKLERGAYVVEGIVTDLTPTTTAQHVIKASVNPLEVNEFKAWLQ